VSFEATKWVLESAPNLPPHLVSTLVALAWHADKNGANAYPSQATLAKYTRKSERAVRNDLAQLLKLGLIRRGDQSAVAHIAADARPAVYDVVMDADADGGKPTSARKPTSPRKRGSARKHSAKGSGSTVPVAGGSPLPPKVVPTELPVEPPVELPLPTPVASGVVNGEIVDETTNLPAPVVEIPNAGQLTRKWIEYCAEHGVKLPQSTIKRYAKSISDAMKQGFSADLIKRALAAMLADGETSRPSLFDNYLVRIQTGPARRLAPASRPSTTDQRVADALALAAKFEEAS